MSARCTSRAASHHDDSRHDGNSVTRCEAYITFEEDIKGTLEPGKLADMVVLSDDLLTIDPARILDVVVEKTILGGRVVFER